MRRFAIALTLALAALPAAAQLKLPRASQKATLTQTVGLTDVTINYSRPGVKGRPVWGTLVPWDQVWRTGANEATVITFSDDVTINGQKLAKGSYSLHTIPNQNEWTLIFNSVADQWGSYSYDQTKDVLRVKAKPEKAEFREWMTFDIPNLSSDEATVVFRWENVAVPFKVNTDSTQRALKAARAAVADWRTPYQAAQFAMQNKLALDEARQWIDQSIRINENAVNLYARARMQADAGDKAGAIRSAEAAIAKATPQQAEFVKEIQRNIETWRK